MQQCCNYENMRRSSLIGGRRGTVGMQLAPTMEPGMGPGTPMTRELITRLIADHGGPEQLDISGRNLQFIALYGLDLHGVILRYATLNLANLSECNLERAILTGACLVGAGLMGANLAGADLRQADLSGADLRGADLSGANLTDASLSHAMLDGARLDRAVLVRATLTSATLQGASLGEVTLEDPGQPRPQPAAPVAETHAGQRPGEELELDAGAGGAITQAEASRVLKIRSSSIVAAIRRGDLIVAPGGSRRQVTIESVRQFAARRQKRTRRHGPAPADARLASGRVSEPSGHCARCGLLLLEDTTGLSRLPEGWHWTDRRHEPTDLPIACRCGDDIQCPVIARPDGQSWLLWPILKKYPWPGGIGLPAGWYWLADESQPKGQTIAVVKETGKAYVMVETLRGWHSIGPLID